MTALLLCTSLVMLCLRSRSSCGGSLSRIYSRECLARSRAVWHILTARDHNITATIVLEQRKRRKSCDAYAPKKILQQILEGPRRYRMPLGFTNKRQPEPQISPVLHEFIQ
ncbi:hypothetical protein OnM2_01480 [Erysiphe neolycopersici]|uniref:Secreted protein n=1 Tax=Erysiphe neolycopersici TaxID=212602 RepID=A0A420HKB3_9PEZI|nr:hypothetical protein OnM2_01480 [Erysiphe neolycopersici]